MYLKGIHRPTLSTTYLLLNKSWMLLLLAACISVSGCKSKKKLAEEKAQEELRAQEEREAFLAPIREKLYTLMERPIPGMDELRIKERDLADLKSLHIDDGEILVMIKKAEYILQQERVRLEAATAQVGGESPEIDPAAVQVDPGPSQFVVGQQVDGLFERVAGARDVYMANATIDEALRLFASERSPVLIIISQERGENDYDKPTTIRKYLEYLKDVRRVPDRVENIVFDANGKIRELELIKR